MARLDMTRWASGVIAAIVLCSASGADGEQPAPAQGFAVTTAPGPPPALGLKEVALQGETFVRGAPVPAWVDPVTIPESSKPDALVLLLADTQFLVDGPAEVSVRRVERINDAGALSKAGQIAIEFVPEYQRVVLHRIRIQRAGSWLDRTQSASLRFLQRETGLEEGLYSGVVTASILIDDLRVGDALEFHYTILGENPVFAGHFADQVSWDQAVPTELRHVSLRYPSRRQISWRFLSDLSARGPTPTRSVVTGQVKLEFREEGLAPIPVESNLPPDFQAYRTLQFSEYQNWDEVVRWAGSLFPRDIPLNAELTRVVDQLGQNADPKARVANALEFVQTQIRYVSVALGENSHRPASPNEVLQRRYGDCKDKTYLLQTLLTHLGIDSHPVLLELGQRHGLERVLPSPLVFNHVILEVELEGRTYYLDATRLGQHPPLERMGQIHQGAQVLPIVANSHGPVKISFDPPGTTPDDDLQERGRLAAIGDDVILESSESWSGVRAEMMRSLVEHLSQQQIDKILLSSMQRRFPAARLDRPVELENSAAENSFALLGHFIVPKLLEEKDGNWFAVIAPPNFAGTLPYPIATDRQIPIGFSPLPSRYRYTLEMDYPESVALQTDPQQKSVEGPGFTLTSSTSYRGHQQRTRLELVTTRDRIEADEIARYDDAVRQIQTLSRVVAFVPKDSVRSGGLLGLGHKDFKDILLERQQAVVKRITTAIEADRLDEADRSRAYCDRGAAQAILGQIPEALQDAERAVHLTPDLPEVFACRAAVYFLAGSFQKSTIDYSHALVLGAEPAETLYRRGISRFYQGDYVNAADDFARSASTARNDHHLYADLWLVWTNQRLHRAVPDEVLQRASSEPRGEWPRPALAMLTGALQPEEMAAIMESKKGDDKELARGEGYFYLAQHYLLSGDLDRAREYLQRCRAQAIVNDSEYSAAKWELERLSAKESTASIQGVQTGAAQAASK